MHEIDRFWPTQVDSVAIDPHSMTVTDRVDFETFPISAKLIRWDIDLHMGDLFGVVSQVLMAAVGIADGRHRVRLSGLVAPVPAPGSAPKTLLQSWNRLSTPSKVANIDGSGAGMGVPRFFGGEPDVFLVIDAVRWRLSTRSVA